MVCSFNYPNSNDWKAHCKVGVWETQGGLNETTPSGQMLACLFRKDFEHTLVLQVELFLGLRLAMHFPSAPPHALAMADVPLEGESASDNDGEEGAAPLLLPAARQVRGHSK